MINKKDLQIIAHLRQDARMPLTTMSRKTNIPVSTIFDRLKANESSLIVKHTCLLDFNKLGYSVRANITFRVERDDKEKLKEFLLKNASVNSLYKINNGFDYLVECIFKQIKDMDSFMDDVENKFRIIDKQLFFIIEDLKKEEFMANPEMIFE